jgi:uncharacterized protein
MARRAAALAVLLPPSEGKAAGGTRTRWDPSAGRFGALGARRAELAAALAAAGGGDAKLLGVGGAHLERARRANATLVGAPTLPAGRRYTGVVYDHLDLASLPPDARKRARSALVVLSGLLGAVGIDDPVPDYRLKMGARLAPFGTLGRWWRDDLSAELNTWLRGRVVVDLLPNEHAAAWTPAGTATVLRVVFVEGDGSRQGAVVGHDAKAAKGLLVRHLLLAGGDPRDALASFVHDRFALRVQTLG